MRGIIILEKIENLDVCPYCNIEIPQGPAYFCPACGKELDEEFSKRKIIFESEDDTPISEGSSYDQSDDEKEDDFTDFTDYGSLFDDDDDFSIENGADYEEEDDFTDFTDYGSLFDDDDDSDKEEFFDEKKSNLDNDFSYSTTDEDVSLDSNSFINDSSYEKDFNNDFDYQTFSDLDEDDFIIVSSSTSDERNEKASFTISDEIKMDEGLNIDNDNVKDVLEPDKDVNSDLNSLNDKSNSNLDLNNELEPDNELAKYNKSIKLDLWLEECVEENFALYFLKYYSSDLLHGGSLTHKIISNYNLENLLEFKYTLPHIDIRTTLKDFFKEMSVIEIINLAKKYDVEVSAMRENLLNNFLKEYSPYNLLILLKKEGYNILEYLDISALEQIYLLDANELEELSKGECSSLDNSKDKLLSCVLKHYEDGFLVSHNRYDRGYDL